ncbi:MAG: HNH endonuclease [Acidobacteria bacterium]|nr:HNH endonuclease [Acidobacteriota bacterium]
MGGAAYRPEHRIVWEQTHGQTLPSDWVVHHLNGVKDDNRPENLAAMPRHEHHTHPRKALGPYEDRIRELEQRLASFSEP